MYPYLFFCFKLLKTYFHLFSDLSVCLSLYLGFSVNLLFCSSTGEILKFIFFNLSLEVRMSS
jgi:hypothetical protein